MTALQQQAADNSGFSQDDIERQLDSAYVEQLKPVLILACIYYFCLACVHLFVSQDESGLLLAAVVAPISLVSAIGYYLLRNQLMDSAYSHLLGAILALGLITENYVQVWVTRSPELISDLLMAIMVFGILTLRRWVFILANAALFSLLVVVLLTIDEFRQYYEDPYRIVIMVSALLLSTIIFEQRRNATQEHTRLRMIDRARAQHLEEANATKDQFLASMSHELRTPLNAIMGFSQILSRKQEISPENQAMLDEILSASNHLLYLISEVLDLSRLQSDKLTINREKVLLSSLCKESMDFVAHMQDELEISTSCTIDPDLELTTVFTDPSKAKQVIVHLLSNAIKYNRINGSVELSLKQKDENHICVVIEDTGAGIAEEELKNLFEPFDRLGREGSTISGSGIGLSMSQKIMQLLEGDIGVESEVGSGTKFWVNFPISET
ncbi:MAG: sensor histidine kinase [Halioglobus sp.]